MVPTQSVSFLVTLNGFIETAKYNMSLSLVLVAVLIGSGIVMRPSFRTF
jgi:hypothetical protein